MQVLLTVFILGYFNYSQDFTYLPSANYGYATLNPGGYSLWKCWVPANQMPVFTLKNQSRKSDFDLFLFNDQSLKYKIQEGVKSGTTTELILGNTHSSDRYIYILVKNTGDRTSEYHFQHHDIDLAEKFGIAFRDASAQYVIEEGLKWLFDVKETDKDYKEKDRNVSRASNLIVSSLNKENLGGSAKNLVINEITSELREAFGYGFWGNLLVNYGILVVTDVYRNYG